MLQNPLKNCYFLVPGLSEKYRSGGLMVIKDVAKMIGEVTGARAHFVTTHEKYPDALAPEDAFTADSLFFVTWGPLVEQHIKLIRSKMPQARIIYYAQSFGWDIKVPPGIPIICVSRFVLAQWVLAAPQNYCGYVPPALGGDFMYGEGERNIDILVHARKQNAYCLNELVPRLSRENFSIKIIEDWIAQNEFAAILKRTKIFLYITEPHKIGFWRRMSGEGFGLPALEALACGAMVGSNLHGGVTDFLTPGENCLKLDSGDLNFDVEQITAAIKNFVPLKNAAEKMATEYSKKSVAKKWINAIEVIENYLFR